MPKRMMSKRKCIMCGRVVFNTIFSRPALVDAGGTERIRIRRKNSTYFFSSPSLALFLSFRRLFSQKKVNLSEQEVSGILTVSFSFVVISRHFFSSSNGQCLLEFSLSLLSFFKFLYLFWTKQQNRDENWESEY